MNTSRSASCSVVKAAALDETDVYANDAGLDATVPNWRLHAGGLQAIKAHAHPIVVRDGKIALRHRVVRGQVGRAAAERHGPCRQGAARTS